MNLLPDDVGSEVPVGAFPIPFLVAAFTFSGLGIVLYNVTAISLTQSLTPERLLGRVNASRRFIVWGTIPIGALLGGTLGQLFGLWPTILVMVLCDLAAPSQKPVHPEAAHLPLVRSPAMSLDDVLRRADG